jgi:hypothetical protein
LGFKTPLEQLRGKIIACAIFIGFFPLAALAFTFLPEMTFRILCIGYWVLIMGLALRLKALLCPACGKSFHCRSLPSGLTVKNGLTMSCLNCGQRLEDENDPNARGDH